MIELVARLYVVIAAIVAYGPPPDPEPLPPPITQTYEQPFNNSDYDLYEVTAYTAGAESTGKTPDHPLYGVTASGAYVEEGVTAACPPALPFGTELRIEGVGRRVCHDRGSAITDGRLDVYIADLDEALEFGRQTLEVEIITMPKEENK